MILFNLNSVLIYYHLVVYYLKFVNLFSIDVYIRGLF
jgi:hypothetical protein